MYEANYLTSGFFVAAVPVIGVVDVGGLQIHIGMYA